MAALAHAMGHSLGAVLHAPHGRAVSLFLPYTIRFSANVEGTRYADIARFLGLPAQDETEGAESLATAIEQLMRRLNQPASIRDLGIAAEEFEAHLSQLVANAETDTSLVMSVRVPDTQELERLFRCAFAGQAVDF
jgi:alcohol dehydrogenase class IV